MPDNKIGGVYDPRMLDSTKVQPAFETTDEYLRFFENLYERPFTRDEADPDLAELSEKPNAELTD